MSIQASKRPSRTFWDLQVECSQLKERVRQLEKAVLELKAKLLEANERNRDLERQATK